VQLALIRHFLCQFLLISWRVGIETTGNCVLDLLVNLLLSHFFLCRFQYHGIAYKDAWPVLNLYPVGSRHTIENLSIYAIHYGLGCIGVLSQNLRTLAAHAKFLNSPCH
jgi:hypothetical protein